KPLKYKEVRVIKGDPTKVGDWQDEVSGHDILINLAGSSIFQRWTEENKRVIRESRILTTRNLVDSLSKAKDSVTLFSTSAVGYYGFCGDEVLTESSPPGRDFLAQVSRDWEEEAKRAEEMGHRVVITRFGIVLGRQGGALAMMMRPFRYFLGAGLGSGRQYFSWIHERDLVAAFLFLTEKEISGPVNLTAPNPVTNMELMRTISKVLKRPIIMPNVPGFLLRLFLGEFAVVLLNGQRVIPKRLGDLGFGFSYPHIEGALLDLLS
ncbi:MAG: TIGR01777 family oxidoreductase, partial [Desulfatiglandales bacterium]